LKYKEAKLNGKIQTAAQSQMDSIQTTSTGVDSKLTAVAVRVDVLHTALSEHVVNEDTSRDQQTAVLREIHKQLVSLNAGMNGTMINQDNAKLIIGYQWNWCRDETVRVVVRSIKDNHFKGNETVVARNVYRGWHKAAKDALASLQKLDGLKYPYNPLFVRHADYIWSCVWDWAVPLYYDKRLNTFDARLADLADRVTGLFDLIHNTHVDVVEDVAVGALYCDTHPTASALLTDDAVAIRMGNKLLSYGDGNESGLRPVAPTPATIRAIIKSNIDDLYKRKSSSSCALPAAHA